MAVAGLGADFVVVLVCAVAAMGGLFLARRIIPADQVHGHNEAAGFIYTGAGVIYAVLLAFVVIAVWQTHSQADDVVIQESAAILSLYRDAEVLPEPTRTNVEGALKNYLGLVISDEWPMLVEGHPSPKAEFALGQIWKDYRELTPQTAWDVALSAESFRQLNEVSVRRSHRLVLAESRLPAILWFFLLGGGVIMVVFTYFFHTNNIVAHAVMVGMTTVLVVSALYIVYAFDEPFSGPIAVSPAAFQHALELTTREKH